MNKEIKTWIAIVLTAVVTLSIFFTGLLSLNDNERVILITGAISIACTMSTLIYLYAEKSEMEE